MSRWWRPLGASADAAVTTFSLDALLRDALSTIRQALAADAVAILVSNQVGDELVSRISLGLAEEVWHGVRILSGAGMAGRVLATRKPLVVADLSTFHLAAPVLVATGLRS